MVRDRAIRFGGDGQNNSTASGEGDGDSALAQEVNEFIQGEGDGGFDAEKSRGQAAEGQGQEPEVKPHWVKISRPKRSISGLMLQPLLAEENKDEKTKTSSTLLGI